jgi:hypothetical protein
MASRSVDSGELVDIEFDDGTVVPCTRNHKWFVLHAPGTRYGRYYPDGRFVGGESEVFREFVVACYLVPGTIAPTRGGGLATIVSISPRKAGTPTTVYSLNVPCDHTYVTTNGIVTGNSIHTWCGASAENFMGWEVERQEIMPRSYRCGKAIVDLGERCLQRLSNYWDRGIAPADHDSEIRESEDLDWELSKVDPKQSTLVLARTKYDVSRARAILAEHDIPCRYTKRREGAHTKDLAMGALWALEHGEGISGEAWGYALEALPSKGQGGVPYLEYGTKAQWKKGLADEYDRVYPEDLPALGVTDTLRGMIMSGEWSKLPDGGTDWYRSAKKFGVEVVSDPKVLVGTVHSSKGMEADRVILLTNVPTRVRDGEENDQIRFDEERRIEYVACTRARYELVLAHDPRSRYRMEIPV